MFNDPLILKVIRIGGTAFLFLWLAQCLFTGGQSARQMSEARQAMLAQALHSQAVQLKGSIRLHVGEYGELPGDYQAWRCSTYSMRCDLREWDGWLYVREEKHWLAFRPALEDGKLTFDCRKTFAFAQEHYRDAYADCQQVAVMELPFDWDAAADSPVSDGAR